MRWDAMRWDGTGCVELVTYFAEGWYRTIQPGVKHNLSHHHTYSSTVVAVLFVLHYILISPRSTIICLLGFVTKGNGFGFGGELKWESTKQTPHLLDRRFSEPMFPYQRGRQNSKRYPVLSSFFRKKPSLWTGSKPVYGGPVISFDSITVWGFIAVLPSCVLA